jgi:hypothetical protein
LRHGELCLGRLAGGIPSNALTRMPLRAGCARSACSASPQLLPRSAPRRSRHSRLAKRPNQARLGHRRCARRNRLPTRRWAGSPDESAEAIDAAQKRATVAGRCYWTRFVMAELDTFIPHERYDVVVVHRAFSLERERATFLQLSRCVHPGGVIIITGNRAGSTDTRSSKCAGRSSRAREILATGEVLSTSAQ